VVPGLTAPGTRCVRTVDFLSLYPTLCDLAGLPLPPHLEGPSLRPLLANPRAEWSRPALTTHGHRNHAVRSERYRYIRYAEGGVELYDHQRDPFEWTNIAGTEAGAAALRDLAGHLPKQEKAPATQGSKAQPD
jgi:arylsulfatase A-like enzyme